jgi:glucose-6-phosphate 1-dehydrogenase
VPDPHALVLFGATGDLADRKVFPALYQLWRANLLPQECFVLGVARRPFDDSTFRLEVERALQEHSRLPVDEASLGAFLQRVGYLQGNFEDPDTFERLKDRLDVCERDHHTSHNRLFYLATQPSAFPRVIAELGRVGLNHDSAPDGWRRIVIEKPFGHDEESAVRLNRDARRVFRERQIYRIDHYLGKETVRNLLVLRFANGIFEPVWNRRYVDHVQITVAESLGTEDRGAYYEETGASRDVLQNHLLQLLSLVAMEPPVTLDAEALRDEKVQVVSAVAGLTAEDVARDVVRGQYGPGWVGGAPVPGYREEPEVDPESETETYVAARLLVDNWRWSGVPFYLRTGKRLPKRATEIAIQFRAVPHRLFRDSRAEPHPNLLAIRIQPDEGILLRFESKMPGLGLEIRPVNMDFTYGSAFSVESPDAYETLILDALLGDPSLFTREDEIETAWAIVTPILEAWIDQPPPRFPSYDAGTWGPAEADALIGRDGRRWRRL